MREGGNEVPGWDGMKKEEGGVKGGKGKERRGEMIFCKETDDERGGQRSLCLAG